MMIPSSMISAHPRDGSDDVITYDVRQYAFSNQRMARWVFINVGMDVMPLDTTSNLYLMC